jgi:hypothetical protein
MMYWSTNNVCAVIAGKRYSPVRLNLANDRALLLRNNRQSRCGRQNPNTQPTRAATKQGLPLAFGYLTEITGDCGEKGIFAEEV